MATELYGITSKQKNSFNSLERGLVLKINKVNLFSKGIEELKGRKIKICLKFKKKETSKTELKTPTFLIVERKSENNENIEKSYQITNLKFPLCFYLHYNHNFKKNNIAVISIKKQTRAGQKSVGGCELNMDEVLQFPKGRGSLELKFDKKKLKKIEKNEKKEKNIKEKKEKKEKREKKVFYEDKNHRFMSLEIECLKTEKMTQKTLLEWRAKCQKTNEDEEETEEFEEFIESKNEEKDQFGKIKEYGSTEAIGSPKGRKSGEGITPKQVNQRPVTPNKFDEEKKDKDLVRKKISQIFTKGIKNFIKKGGNKKKKDEVGRMRGWIDDTESINSFAKQFEEFVLKHDVFPDSIIFVEKTSAFGERFGRKFRSISKNLVFLVDKYADNIVDTLNRLFEIIKLDKEDVNHVKFVVIEENTGLYHVLLKSLIESKIVHSTELFEKCVFYIVPVGSTQSNFISKYIADNSILYEKHFNSKEWINSISFFLNPKDTEKRRSTNSNEPIYGRSSDHSENNEEKETPKGITSNEEEKKKLEIIDSIIQKYVSSPQEILSLPISQLMLTKAHVKKEELGNTNPLIPFVSQILFKCEKKAIGAKTDYFTISRFDTKNTLNKTQFNTFEVRKSLNKEKDSMILSVGIKTKKDKEKEKDFRFDDIRKIICQIKKHKKASLYVDGFLVDYPIKSLSIDLGWSTEIKFAVSLFGEGVSE